MSPAGFRGHLRGHRSTFFLAVFGATVSTFFWLFPEPPSRMAPIFLMITKYVPTVVFFSVVFFFVALFFSLFVSGLFPVSFSFFCNVIRDQFD